MYQSPYRLSYIHIPIEWCIGCRLLHHHRDHSSYRTVACYHLLHNNIHLLPEVPWDSASGSGSVTALEAVLDHPLERDQIQVEGLELQGSV